MLQQSQIRLCSFDWLEEWKADYQPWSYLVGFEPGTPGEITERLPHLAIIGVIRFSKV